MDLGGALKQIRQKRKKTQLDVVEKVAISQTWLSQIEAGIKEPSPEMLKRLCKFYKVPVVIVMWLATETADVAKDKRGAFIELSPAINDLVKEFI